MTPVTRYLVADNVDSLAFAARLIRKVRALNFTVIVHCGDDTRQKGVIQALNRLKLEPQLDIQSGAIAVCVDARAALSDTSNSIMLKLIKNSLLLNLEAAHSTDSAIQCCASQSRLTEFSRFERYAEVHNANNSTLAAAAEWFQHRGYPLQDHPIAEA